MQKKINVSGDSEAEYIFAHVQAPTKLCGLLGTSRSKQCGLRGSTVPKSVDVNAWNLNPANLT